MKPKDLPIFRDAEARKVVASTCAKHGVRVQLFRALLEVQRSYAGMGKQQGISMEFDARFSETINDEEAS